MCSTTAFSAPGKPRRHCCQPSSTWHGSSSSSAPVLISTVCTSDRRVKLDSSCALVQDFTQQVRVGPSGRRLQQQTCRDPNKTLHSAPACSSSTQSDASNSYTPLISECKCTLSIATCMQHSAQHACQQLPLANPCFSPPVAHVMLSPYCVHPPGAHTAAAWSAHQPLRPSALNRRLHSASQCTQ